MITKISAYIMPFVILIIVGYGMYKKSDNYDNFVNGAEDGMRTVVSIAPTLIGLMVAVGFLEFIAELLSGVCGKLGIPASIVPLIIVRLFSSSAATGLSLDIFKQFGTDSYTGLITSILMGCTETVFYTMSVYYMAACIKKTRWTLAGALIATAAGIAASVILARYC
jgi:spore maturation protein B